MKRVQLVGILNITPDSFSDGGQYLQPGKAVAHARQLFEDGAAIVDVGAESTNPRSTALTAAEEWQRLEPVLAELIPAFPGKISLDSYHPETIARAAAQFGAKFIANDVTGMNNPAMREVVAHGELHCIVSHLPARFGTDIAAAHHDATIGDEQTVLQELLERRAQLMALGVPKAHIILDPGIGFGKTPELNQRLLRFARLAADSEVMVGYSRKRFLGEQRFELAPNLAAADIAVESGAAYLRVHDVKAHAEHLFGNRPA